MQVSQKYLKEESKKLENFKFSNVVKTLQTEEDMPEFKIYDLRYYDDELDKFEGMFLGEITIGNLKITKQIVTCLDRLEKTKHCDESFTTMTKVVCVDAKPVATMAMVHGFAESSMRSYLETAMHHALNGFEAVLIDMKSHGFASGVRGSKYTVYCWHE